MFESVLIANRGEIAVRIARTCRELGIRVIAVYSSEDHDSQVVRLADRSVHIGPSPARGSYLNMAAILEAARMTGAQAIHPGYGFLSEDADFARACRTEGRVFIGPPPDVIEQLGDKAAARELMSACGAPLLAGRIEPVTSIGEARELADVTGYPLVVKAVAGGGGRGIGVAWTPGDLDEIYLGTRATAQTLFGDSRVYLERYLASARHVEIQVLCDQHGNAVHLGARDCSIQRRHQKLIEESPAPGLPRELIEQMGETALRGARKAGYVSAGTFEFLVAEDHSYYFLEVNPRIQVEHPVTEMVTGVDLIAEQLRIAAGLELTAGGGNPSGAAIECRVNVEDPERDFAPSPGTLTEFQLPAGPFVRVDTHAHLGYPVPPFYDSLIAKVVVWAPDRDQAVARMGRALSELRVGGHGVHATSALLASVMRDPLFRAGRYDTSFLDTFLTTSYDQKDDDDPDINNP